MLVAVVTFNDTKAQFLFDSLSDESDGTIGVTAPSTRFVGGASGSLNRCKRDFPFLLAQSSFFLSTDDFLFTNSMTLRGIATKYRYDVSISVRGPYALKGAIEAAASVDTAYTKKDRRRRSHHRPHTRSSTTIRCSILGDSFKRIFLLAISAPLLSYGIDNVS